MFDCVIITAGTGAWQRLVEKSIEDYYIRVMCSESGRRRMIVSGCTSARETSYAQLSWKRVDDTYIRTVRDIGFRTNVSRVYSRDVCHIARRPTVGDTGAAGYYVFRRVLCVVGCDYVEDALNSDVLTLWP